jgi:hypothetical protein
MFEKHVRDVMPEIVAVHVLINVKNVSDNSVFYANNTLILD